MKGVEVLCELVNEGDSGNEETGMNGLEGGLRGLVECSERENELMASK